MIRQITFCVLITALVISGCSEEHGTSPTSFDYEELPAPENFEITAGTYSLTLSWDYSPGNLALTEEFFVYLVNYTQYGEMLYPIDTISVSDYLVSEEVTYTELAANMEFCFRVSAADSNDMEGWRTGIECGITLAP
ncbi:MAG: hypothetical protein U5O15_04880 [Candidatus Krumholzibacteriota bacterium]|nr:hypothetical protein [Candidatus Krumholzibacteriota bacterium]